MVAFSTNRSSPALAKPNMTIISHDTLLAALINQGNQNSVSGIGLRGHYSWQSSRVPIKPKCHPHYTQHEGWEGSITHCVLPGQINL